VAWSRLQKWFKFLAFGGISTGLLCSFTLAIAMIYLWYKLVWPDVWSGIYVLPKKSL
jgi:hypothetical protein